MNLLVIIAASFAAASCTNANLSAQKATDPGARPTASVVAPSSSRGFDDELTGRLTALSRTAGGKVGVAVIHLETGRVISVEGGTQLPLYSVFKLPLAVTVLKAVEEKRLALDKKIRVTPKDVAPGSQFNRNLWVKPVDCSVLELLEFSIVRSDNTSSDKLLELVGGTGAVTELMRKLGFPSIDIHVSSREFAANRSNPNLGSANDLARLLAQLQQGRILQAAQLEVLMGFMSRSRIGEKRIRGDLPANTPVADKTGTGEAGSNTNDVGIITLPDGKGHLAMAVLMSGSRLSPVAQEKVIAQLARLAFDAHVSAP
jgi:beta-lactamase class A